MLTFSAATQRLLLALTLALTACGGEDGPSDTDGTSDAEKDAGDTKRDSSRPDAGTPIKDDGGPTVPNKSDASSDDPKLNALAGRYLMRWDVLGTATSPNPLGELKIRSRLSTLVVAELAVKDGRLVSTERICTQVAAQKCLENTCSKANTTVDERTINNFLLKRTQERAWSLAADGTVTGAESTALLGYDDEDPNASLPTENTDERVWDVDTSNSVNEGFLTRISVTLGIPINCTAYGTQKYVSILKGKLDGSEAEAVELDLDVNQSDA
ncbi:MAG TPA: hypothetical protein VFX59_13160, partial [Polyangiales bacterium]|nr:hypothetical protein [Polyangiales bacterium]